MHIRQARADEWQALRALRLQALADTPTAFCATLAAEQAMPDSAWQARAEKNAGDETPCFVAENDGALVGMVVGSLGPDPNEAWLMSMYVAAAARGHGVGQRLVEEVAAWARRHKRGRLVLETNLDNAPAKDLYLRCGFIDTGIHGPMSSGTGTQTRMERAL